MKGERGREEEEESVDFGGVVVVAPLVQLS